MQWPRSFSSRKKTSEEKGDEKNEASHGEAKNEDDYRRGHCRRRLYRHYRHYRQRHHHRH